MAKARNDRPEKPKAKSKVEAVPHHVIESLEVTGGFLNKVKLQFADGLNCLIGGRGTGKTTVLELIRYALGLMPDEKLDQTRSRALKGLVQSNLGPGRIRIGVRTKHGMRYVAERAWNESGQVLDEAGEPTAISFDRGDTIFKADVYSTNEIEEIAMNPSYQLALLDKFIEDDVRRIEVELRRVLRDLEKNAGELIRVDGEIADLRESVSELPALEEKLKGIQLSTGPESERVETAHSRKVLREKERKTLEGLHDDVYKVRTDLASILTALVVRLDGRIDTDVASGPNKDLVDAVGAEVSKLSAQLKRVAAEIPKAAEVADAFIAEHESKLAERHAKQEAEYRELVTRSEQETGRANERSQLQRRYAEVASAGKELGHKDKERRDKAQQRQELLSKLSSLRDERYQLRRKVTETSLEPLQAMVRVTITQAGNRDAYRALVTEALRGQNIKYTALVDKLVQNVTPSELALHVHRGDAATLAEQASLDEERAQRVIDVLSGSVALYKLDTVDLEDLPRIELREKHDYKDSTRLSTGQRCTTILPILLLESERPLLIDQPEDNLDNRFIFETVVTSLATAKGRRQLIFATHNPNIPVLGDAERVFVMESDGRTGKPSNAGTVDDLKDDIELLLEGGSEAFQRRKERYGY